VPGCTGVKNEIRGDQEGNYIFVRHYHRLFRNRAKTCCIKAASAAVYTFTLDVVSLIRLLS